VCVCVTECDQVNSNLIHLMLCAEDYFVRRKMSE